MTVKAFDRKNQLFSIALLLLVVVIIIARCPELLKSPRFWAEEGEVYFLAAFQSGFWKSLFLQHMGYYNIVPNVATALATLVPLELAPFATTYIAFFFQVLVSAVVIFGNSPFWDTWPKKLLIACGIQLINPFEVWLTTICVHFWLCIATFFILLERPYDASPIRRNFHRLMLVVAGLSSVSSIFLAPVFLFKAWRNRLSEFWIQAGILVIAGLIQVCALATCLLNHEPLASGGRFGQNKFNLSEILKFHLFFNLFKPFSDGIFIRPVSAGILIAVCAGLGLFIIYLFFRTMRDKKYLTIFLAIILVVVMSTLLSINMASSARYGFAPSAMILVILVNESLQSTKKNSCRLAIFYMIVIMVSCISGFRSSIYYSPDFPRWHEEVMSWRMDTNKPLKIWPQFKGRTWQISLQLKRSLQH